MASFEALPKPVTAESLLAAASTLPPREKAQFSNWLDDYADYLLDRLNA
jgi:hypothetical protein